MNVAYHLGRLGRTALPVSAVGQDADGRGLLDVLQQRGLSLEGVAVHPELPTGVVQAGLDAAGNAHYTIQTEVAWDDIPLGHAVLEAAPGAAALVFGSLAQRSAANRGALQRLREAVSPETYQVFDVNLRPPHDDLSLVGTLAHGAQVVKMNHDEAAQWSGGEPGEFESHARAIAAETGVPTICVTAGALGAGLLHEGRWDWQEGRAVAVVDTIGAGDAFLAALIDGLLAGLPPDRILARACRLGEFVAGHAGAMPDYESRSVFGG